MLDHQVVRAATKAYKAIQSSGSASSPTLLPSSAYLRFLLPSNKSSPPPLTSLASWSDASTLVLLLEWRAALVVRSYTIINSASDGELDAGASRRVSHAVTEAFVAAQILDMIRGLRTTEMPNQTKEVVEQLYLLVRSPSFHSI